MKRRFQTNFKVLVSFAFVAIFASLAHSSMASAQTANTLRVSPIRSDVQIEPGQSKIVQITVSNLTGASITVHPSVNDFVSGDERGTPALILDEDKFAPSHSLKKFISPLKDVIIPVGEAKTFDVKVTVPADAQAGGYFGAVRFAPTDGDSGGQVNLSPSVASLILLTVPGDIIQKLTLTEFTVQQRGTTGSSFATPDEITAKVRFENKGNVQVGPFGRVSVKQGDKIVYETDFNNKDQRDMILPDSARVWDIPLKNIGAFGYYTVLSTFTYGDKNETVEAVQSFWIIPPYLIIAAIVALVVLIGLVILVIVLVRRSQKRRHLPRARRR
jgi:hypothetical protein